VTLFLLLLVALPFHPCRCCEFLEEEKKTAKMARWFRSEPMEYISLIVNEDAAHDCLADLGKLGVIQFTDVSGCMTASSRF